MEDVKKHSEIGASGCERWWNCPGSVALIKKAPPQETSLPAAEGTAAHELAELVLGDVKIGNEPDIYTHIGTTIMVDDHEIEITEEMADGVVVYLDAISKDAHRFGTNYSLLSIEEQFKLEVDDGAWGRNDAVLYKPFDTLYVYDLKFGKGIIVEVKDNKQLLYYALGAMQGKDVEAVELCIVQPRAYHPDGPVRRFKYDVKDLLVFEKELKVHIDATRVKDAPRCPGKHCKFCPAISICPEIVKEANEVAAFDFKEVSSIPFDTLIKLTDMSERIIDFLKEVKGHLKNQAEKGVDVPGYKLVKAQSRRVWKDEVLLLRDFRSKYGDKLWINKVKSPAQIEKLSTDRDEFLKYIIKPDKGLTLVRFEDPRTAVKSSAEEDFKNL